MFPSLPRPAIFFDRDGTLIEDRGYLRSPTEIVVQEGILSALRRLRNHYLFFIVTNQSGIGLGVLSHEDVERVNESIVRTLADGGVFITAVYYCPHCRDQGCECIKPKPYFLQRAATEFNVDLSRSFVIGDHPIDVELARNVGAEGIYLMTGHGQKHLDELPPDVFVAENMEEAARRILGRESLQTKEVETRLFDIKHYIPDDSQKVKGIELLPERANKFHKKTERKSGTADLDDNDGDCRSSA